MCNKGGQSKEHERREGERDGERDPRASGLLERSANALGLGEGDCYPPIYRVPRSISIPMSSFSNPFLLSLHPSISIFMLLFLFSPHPMSSLSPSFSLPSSLYSLCRVDLRGQPEPCNFRKVQRASSLFASVFSYLHELF